MSEGQDDDPMMGTGGLTLGPPGARNDALEIGFAPDLEETDFVLPEDDPVVDKPKVSARGRYPLAEAALDRLLGRETEERPLEDFQIGPAVTRPAPEIARPAPISMEGPPARDNDPDNLVDMMLVGHDDGTPRVHLAFNEDVMGGLQVSLEQREDGLFAIFLVDDINDRRHLEATVGTLLARLEAKGTRVVGHEIKTPES